MNEVSRMDQTLKLLNDFVLDNEDLERLEQRLARFNIFEALRRVRREREHSDFLGFLLDPKATHGFGELFLKQFLKKAVAEGAGSSASISAAELEAINLSSTQVQREWKDIDILLKNKESRLAVIIENKIDSTEHSNQLKRYFNYIEGECPHWKIIGLYLTPDKDDPSDREKYWPIDYKLVCETVQWVIRMRGSDLASNVLLTLNDYIEMLRRHLMTESDISALCKRIYAKHREALDLIYEHRPDPQLSIRELLEQIIGRNQDLVVDKSTKSHVRFLPKDWDTAALKRGSGWTSSGRMLMFEFENAPDALKLHLYLGPGPQDIREKIFASALRRNTLFIPSGNLSEKWKTLFSNTFLSGESREGDYDDNMKNQIERQWGTFIDGPLPNMLKAFENESWMRE